PPRGQRLWLRRSPPVRDAARRRLLLQRGLSPRRLGDRGSGPQLGGTRSRGSRGVGYRVIRTRRRLGACPPRKRASSRGGESLLAGPPSLSSTRVTSRRGTPASRRSRLAQAPGAG